MSKQLETLKKAIEICGSVSELSRRVNKGRAFIYVLRDRAKTISSTKDLCQTDLAMEIEIVTNHRSSWKDLCPRTADTYKRLTS